MDPGGSSQLRLVTFIFGQSYVGSTSVLISRRIA